MDTTITITIDPLIGNACLFLPSLGGGLFLLLWGLHLRRRAFAQLPRPVHKSDQHWWRQLAKWGAISSDGAGWVVLQEFTRSFDLLFSSVLIGLGLVLLL